MEINLPHSYSLLAVSTRPPAGHLSRCARALLSRPCGPLSAVFIARIKFSRPLRASVRIFISYRAARSIVSALWASVSGTVYSVEIIYFLKFLTLQNSSIVDRKATPSDI